MAETALDVNVELVSEITHKYTDRINRVISEDDWHTQALSSEQIASRIPNCGIFCELIARCFKAEGISVRQLIRDTSALEVVPGRHPEQQRHVICNPTGTDIIIEPTYSQFLGEFGLSYFLMQYGKSEADVYPEERALVFPSSEREVVAGWLRTCLDTYWRNDGYSAAAQKAYLYSIADSERWDPQASRYFRSSDSVHAEAFFTNLWDLDAYVEHEPPLRLTRIGEELYEKL